MANDEEYLDQLATDLIVCRCGHVESFHDDGKGDKGTWCLALNCGCGEWSELIAVA